jgi:hypothetical protein
MSVYQSGLVFSLLILLLFFFKVGYYYIVQVGLELAILLPQPLKCWDYKCAPSCLALSTLKKMYYKPYAQILENKVISDHPMATIQPVLSFQLIFLSGFFFSNGSYSHSWLYAMVWMCSPKIYMLKPSTHSEAIKRWTFGRWLGHKGGVLLSNISILVHFELP